MFKRLVGADTPAKVEPEKIKNEKAENENYISSLLFLTIILLIIHISTNL